jgi:hypothetical protein
MLWRGCVVGWLLAGDGSQNNPFLEAEGALRPELITCALDC